MRYEVSRARGAGAEWPWLAGSTLQALRAPAELPNEAADFLRLFEVASVPGALYQVELGALPDPSHQAPCDRAVPLVERPSYHERREAAPAKLVQTWPKSSLSPRPGLAKARCQPGGGVLTAVLEV